MSGQTQAFIGIVVCLLALSTADLLLLQRTRKVEQAVKKLSTSLYALKDDALAAIEGRRKELDKREREIHEEMGKLTVAILRVTMDMQEFINMLRAPRFIVDLEEALYGRKAGRGGHSPGGGGAEGGASTQDDLPDAQGEAGGGR